MMMMMPSSSSYFGVVLLLLLVVLPTVSKCQYYSGTTVVVDAFSPSFTGTTVRTRLLGSMNFSSCSSSSSRKADGDMTRLYMAKATKNKKKKKTTGGGGSGGGLKGFGSPTIAASSSPSSSSSSSTKVEVDRSKETRAFYDFLEHQGAGSNLNRCALGNFQITDQFKLRGVVALRQVKKGDDIINIPYDCAINLGQEGSDPTIPALKLLTDYCETLSSSSSSSSQESDGSPRRAAYYRMLPPFEGDDCMGSTDFFSDQALEALQSPLIKEETLNRRQLVKTRFEQAEFGSAASGSTDGTISWIDGTPLTERHLLWAVWLITSRVLTVQGQEGTGQSFRLLIPFLDMCNHDRSSTHILTGRAVPGGELKVVAGSKVSEGDPINIVYGGGNAGNNRFIQDYGFIDTTRSGSSKKLLMKDSSVDDNDDNNVAAAFTMVAQELVGKRRAVEGASANRYLSQTDRTRSLDALSETTIEDDERLLADETDSSLISAYRYRIGVKRALSKLGAFDES
mmetsp:Transcript_4229/g.10528  ORF Transcript_4229/g.10528 Transcript_4229/m.10528 type:complete len:510 (-) Transcript_4229:232-1761(-)